MQLFNYDGSVMMRKEVPILPGRRLLRDPSREFGHSAATWISSAVTKVLKTPGWREDVMLKGKGLMASYEHTMHGEAGITAAPLAHNCIPRWGLESPSQRYLFLLTVAILLFALIAIPLMIVFWLVFASVYYITIEQEFRRRENIEAIHSQLKKKDL
jgi:hypothetical protein